MMTLTSYFLLILASVLAIPTIIFFLEVLAALVLPSRHFPPVPREGRRPRAAVLVPAHNESTGLIPTIDDIKMQLRDGDRLLVVADNCADDTALVASAAGAEIVQRDDHEKIGKGYALDFGLRHLSADPPDVVIMIDADCRVADGTIERLATVAAMTRRPVQALDLMTASLGSPVNYQVAEFAWRIKNWVRPLGLQALGLSCQLMGTGMAFPWEIIRSANLASGHIVEDIKLGLDFVLSGSPPIFCPSAAVTSQFPVSAEGADRQRERWEHGHLQTILTLGPRFFNLAVIRINLNLLALVFDLAVPPLSLLGLLLTVVFVIAAVATLFGVSSGGLVISAVSLAAYLASVILAWSKYGREILPPAALIQLGPFVAGKLDLYRRLLSHGFVSQWIRTDRSKLD